MFDDYIVTIFFNCNSETGVAFFMQKKQYEKNAKITVKSLAHFRRTGHNMGANDKKQGTLTTTPIFCQ